MSKAEELQKRVEHLETEVELLKELIKLQNKCSERVIPTYPTEEPILKPPFKFTCGGEEQEIRKENSCSSKTKNQKNATTPSITHQWEDFMTSLGL